MTPRWRRAAALVLALGVAAHAEAASPVQLRTTDGVTIAATWYEAGASAPAVVLVPMFTRTRDDWRTFAERLNAAGLSALAIDLRGGHLMRVTADGKVAEGWGFTDDQDALDEFFRD